MSLQPGYFRTPVSAPYFIFKDGRSEIKSIKVSLTNAEIKALRASPKELVPAPGADKIIFPISGFLKLNAGTNVLTESADNLAIEWDGGDAAACSQTIESTGFIDQSADTITSFMGKIDAIDAYADVANKNIALANTGDGEIAGNAAEDATLDVYLFYQVVDFSV